MNEQPRESNVIDDDTRTELAVLIEELNENAVLDLVHRRLEAGDDPMVIIAEAEAGMRLVGKRHEQGEYFIAGLIMAGHIFGEVMELTLPLVESRSNGDVVGIVLIGTVQGDIHDLGKSIVDLLLQTGGFKVYDLGVDVPPERFVAKVLELRPDIVGLSGLLTQAYDSMKETISLLRIATSDWPKPLPIIIGGNQLDEQVRVYVGADYWTSEALDGVRICQRLMKER